MVKGKVKLYTAYLVDKIDPVLTQLKTNNVKYISE